MLRINGKLIEGTVVATNVHFRTNPNALDRQKSRILRRLAHLMEQARLYLGEERLRELLKEAAKPKSSSEQRQIERKRNAHIKHLVPTRGGAKWVVERLPRNDYANFDPKVPTVDELLSKPIGYRLSKGFNVIRHGNLDRH